MSTPKNNKQEQFQPYNKIHYQLLHNKLSNIEQDLQMQSQIRMPNINTNKNKSIPYSSQIELNKKIKRIINIQSTHSTPKYKNSNNSALSYNSLHNPIYSSNSTYKTIHSNKMCHNQNLPTLTRQLTQKKQKQSSLDKILTNQQKYKKIYFTQLEKLKIKQQQNNKQQQQDNLIQFQFPEIRVNNWKISGYIKQNYMLLKGIDKQLKICIKKYKYDKVYDKIKRDYQSWVESKFCFQT